VQLPISGAQERPTVESLKLEFDVERAELRKPIQELQTKYEQQLGKLLEEVTSAGELERTLAVKAEIEGYKEGKTKPAGDGFPELKRLQGIYADVHAQRTAMMKKELGNVVTAYRAKLLALQKELTKERKIEDALAVKAVIDGINLEDFVDLVEENSLERTSNPEEEESGEEVVVIGKDGKNERDEKCEFSRDGDRFVLHTAMANAPIQSRKDFQAPFRMLARVETDGSLRFYFGENGCVFFNWQTNPEVLRIGDPRTPLSDQRAFAGEGKLHPGQTYDIEIAVEKERITVNVDGKKRAELEGSFAEESEGTIGIGAAWGSHVKVEYFKGIQQAEAE